MHVTTGLVPGFVIAYVENLAILCSVIIVITNYRKTPYDCITDTLFKSCSL